MSESILDTHFISVIVRKTAACGTQILEQTVFRKPYIPLEPLMVYLEETHIEACAFWKLLGLPGALL